MALHNLVKEIVETGEKSVTYYQFQGFREEKPVTKAEKKEGKKPTWGPVMMGKGRFNSMFESLESLENNITDMKYSTLVKFAETKLSAGLSLYVTEMQEKFPEQKEILRPILISIKERIAELDENKSVADPYGDCKRRFCKSGIFSAIVLCNDPAALVHENIQKEINNLLELQKKAKEVSTADYILFLKDKEGKNGVNEDGFVMLRDTSEKPAELKPATIPGENS